MGVLHPHRKNAVLLYGLLVELIGHLRAVGGLLRHVNAGSK